MQVFVGARRRCSHSTREMLKSCCDSKFKDEWMKLTLHFFCPISFWSEIELQTGSRSHRCVKEWAHGSLSGDLQEVCIVRARSDPRDDHHQDPQCAENKYDPSAALSSLCFCPQLLPSFCSPFTSFTPLRLPHSSLPLPQISSNQPPTLLTASREMPTVKHCWLALSFSPVVGLSSGFPFLRKPAKLADNRLMVDVRPPPSLSSLLFSYILPDLFFYFCHFLKRLISS